MRERLDRGSYNGVSGIRLALSYDIVDAQDSRSQDQQDLDQWCIVVLIATQLCAGRDVTSTMDRRSRPIGNKAVTSGGISGCAAVDQLDVLPDQGRDKAVAFLGDSGERAQVFAWYVGGDGEYEFFGEA
jgi:hypothetical protein